MRDGTVLPDGNVQLEPLIFDLQELDLDDLGDSSDDDKQSICEHEVARSVRDNSDNNNSIKNPRDMPIVNPSNGA